MKTTKRKIERLRKRTTTEGREEVQLRVPVTQLNVNRDTGVLSDLVLLESDREATGHGIYIDGRTIETALEAVDGGRLRAYIAHPTFMQWLNDEDRLMEAPGWFEEISDRSGRLVAGKMEFYEAFREGKPEAYAQLLEMAEKTPDLFGLSIEAWGYAVFVAADGTEYSEAPEDVELQYNGMPAFRIVELDAAAFVSQPAATSGLFAGRLGKVFGGAERKGVEELARAVAAWQLARDGGGSGFGSGVDGLGGHRYGNQAASGSEDFGGRAAAGNGNQEEDDMNKIIKALKAKYKDDEARLQRALLIAANSETPEKLTVESVERQLNAAEGGGSGEGSGSGSGVDGLGGHRYGEGSGSGDSLMAALKAKYADDQERLSRALMHVAKAPEGESLTVERVENALLAADHAELQKKNADFERVKKERDDFEKRFNDIRESGHLGGVPTGSPYVLSGKSYEGYTAKALAGLQERGAMAANFAITSIDDLWIPSVWIPGAAEQVPIATDFMASGAVVSNPVLDQAASGGGTQIDVPNFREPDHNDEPQQEGTGPSLNGITDGKQVAVRLNRVNTLGASALAGGLSGSDPIGYALGAINRMRQRNRLRVLIETLRGLFGTTGAGAYSALRNDNFIEDGDNAAAANLIDSDMFYQSIDKLVENIDMLQGGAMLAHPTIVTALTMQDDIDFIKPSEGDLRLRVYKKQIPIFSSSLLVRDGTTTGKVYDTYVFSPGSVGIGFRPQVNRVGDIASLVMKEDEHLNEQTVYDRTSGFVHPAWAQWTGTPANAKGGPSNTELATEGNWALGAENVENVGIVQIKTNG